MGLAEQIAAALGKSRLSLIVSDGNPGAIRLYQRLGYRDVARRLIVKQGWEHAGQNWVLMTKPLSSRR